MQGALRAFSVGLLVVLPAVVGGAVLRNRSGYFFHGFAVVYVGLVHVGVLMQITLWPLKAIICVRVRARDAG